MKNILLILTALFLSAPSVAADRVIKCQVDSSDGAASYKGMCVFSPDTNGSFSLSNPVAGKPLLDGLSVVTVTLVSKGLAEVFGLTREGINSRWGEAKRSQTDKACWEGEDFKVCAW